MSDAIDLLNGVSEQTLTGLLAGDPELARYLDRRAASRPAATRPFRMVVATVEPGDDDVTVCGWIASGSVRPGDEVTIALSGLAARIDRISAGDRELHRAGEGEAVTVSLDRRPAIEPGDLIGSPQSAPRAARLIQATILWLGEDPLLRGRSYELRIGAATATATVAPVRYRLDLDAMQRVAATSLERLQIGVCDLELSAPIAFDQFRENPPTGSFVLIDRISGRAVGVGLIEFALRRSANIRWQQLTVDQQARAEAMGQTPCALWFTGLSGAGKSTVANQVEAELHLRRRHTYLLDGDNVRHGLNRDLGFTDADRVENIRRVAEVSRLMVDAGLIVIVSFISPFASERRMARALFEPGRFLEVFVDTPLQIAEQRDPKGLYAKARRGELINFTGIDSPYEPPEHPELHLEMAGLSAEQAAGDVIGMLEARGLVPLD